jgi:hypothetical protein
MFLGTILVAGLTLCRVNLSATGATARLWRLQNPFLALSGVYLVAYFAKLAKRLVRRLEDLGLKVTVSQAA